jgi:polysaccharide chain length determinant protein (PEP-CTERM system associated)
MAASRIVPDGRPGDLTFTPVAMADEGNDDLGFNIDVRRTLVRYRWLILLPACTVIGATLAVIRLLPNRYTSEATLVVVQQQVPERYVTPNSTTPVSVELQAMTQEVLSRARLQNIIQRFGLYPKEVKKEAPEKVLAQMQKDIDIVPVSETASPAGRDFNAFKISFIGDSPVEAQQVTSMLTSLFITENLKTREDQATNTTTFLNEQLKLAKERLEEQDQRLRDFKMQHLGELPEQQQGNLGILTSLQAQLQSTTTAMSRAREQRVYLETLVSGFQSMRSRNMPVQSNTEAAPGAVMSPADTAQTVLARLRSEREALVSRYTATHPDVVSKDKELEAAKMAVSRIEAEAAKNVAPAPPRRENQLITAPDPTDLPVIAQTKSQLEANRLEIENLAKEHARVKAEIDQYQNRLNQTPVREQQLTGLLRDYELQKQNYTDLLNKKLQSQLATNLEKDQGGRQFRLVDPPSLPTLPSSPNRRKMGLGGTIAGVALGLALAAVMALRDKTFHTEKDINRRFSLSLVVGVPMLETNSERRVRILRTSLEWLAGSILVIAVLAAEAYVLRH